MSHPQYARPIDALLVFYDDRMVADIESFSPSAGKPLAALASWQCLGISLQIRMPDPVTREQLILAHNQAYVEGVMNGALRNGFGNTHPAVTASLPWTTGAMLSAAREAISNGRTAVAPCSGFHHAGYSSGGGFCTFNGLMVTALALLHEGNATRIGILDCDQHYGDGTDDIRRELRVMTQIPHYSAGGKWSKSSEAKSFLHQLPKIIESFAGCDVLLYQAGADPHVDDPLGGWLTTEQLADRDYLVFDTAAKLGLPIAWNLAGGYQTPLRRVLDIHDNTLRACAAIYLAVKAHSRLALVKDLQ
jgi:acetoin utilization deacetylase AcuC-like enzyme